MGQCGAQRRELEREHEQCNRTQAQAFGATAREGAAKAQGAGGAAQGQEALLLMSSAEGRADLQPLSLRATDTRVPLTRACMPKIAILQWLLRSLSLYIRLSYVSRVSLNRGVGPRVPFRLSMFFF